MSPQSQVAEVAARESKGAASEDPVSLLLVWGRLAPSPPRLSGSNGDTVHARHLTLEKDRLPFSTLRDNKPQATVLFMQVNKIEQDRTRSHVREAGGQLSEAGMARPTQSPGERAGLRSAGRRAHHALWPLRVHRRRARLGSLHMRTFQCADNSFHF